MFLSPFASPSRSLVSSTASTRKGWRGMAARVLAPPLPVSCTTRPHLPPAPTPFVPVAARTPSSWKKRRRPSAHRPDSLRTSSTASLSAGKQRCALHPLGRNAAPFTWWPVHIPPDVCSVSPSFGRSSIPLCTHVSYFPCHFPPKPQSSNRLNPRRNAG